MISETVAESELADSKESRSLRRHSRQTHRYFYPCVVAIPLVLFLSFGAWLFERCGGLDTFVPTVIDTIRDNILGDDVVLEMERTFYGFMDFMRQENQTLSRQERSFQPFNPALLAANFFVDKGAKPLLVVPRFDEPPDIARRRLTLLAQSAPGEGVIPLPTGEVISKMERLGEVGVQPSGEIPSDVPLADATDTIMGASVQADLATLPEATPEPSLWEDVFDPTPSVSVRPLYSSVVLKPDPKRDYAVVHLYRFDPQRYRLEFIAGKDPKRNLDGKMTDEQKQKVEWMFNGGFKYRHGNFGIKYKGNMVYPPKAEAATLLFDSSDEFQFVEWPAGKSDEPAIPTFRQNELPLIKDGELSPKIDRTWGSTPKDTDPIYTERSAFGLTRNGWLVFALGKNLSAETLAKAMLEAGVISAMHLDMNHYNVHLIKCKRDAKGKLKTSTAVEGYSWYKGIYEGESERDFFILTKRDI